MDDDDDASEEAPKCVITPHEQNKKKKKKKMKMKIEMCVWLVRSFVRLLDAAAAAGATLESWTIPTTGRRTASPQAQFTYCTCGPANN